MALRTQKMEVNFSVFFLPSLSLWFLFTSLFNADGFLQRIETRQQGALDSQLFSMSCQENSRRGFWLNFPWVRSPSLVTVAAVPTMAKRMGPSLMHPRAPGVGVCYQKRGAGIWHLGEVLGLAIKDNSHIQWESCKNGDQLIWIPAVIV